MFTIRDSCQFSCIDDSCYHRKAQIHRKFPNHALPYIVYILFVNWDQGLDGSEVFLNLYFSVCTLRSSFLFFDDILHLKIFSWFLNRIRSRLFIWSYLISKWKDLVFAYASFIWCWVNYIVSLSSFEVLSFYKSQYRI